MEFSSAEADYQEAAKKDVANQLTVSIINSQDQGPLVGTGWKLVRCSLFSVDDRSPNSWRDLGSTDER